VLKDSGSILVQATRPTSSLVVFVLVPEHDGSNVCGTGYKQERIEVLRGV
jgi:hypothetical protein